MLSAEVLLIAAFAELFLLVLAIAVVFGHGAWLRREAEMQDRMRPRAENSLVVALEDAPLTADILTDLHAAPRRLQISAIMQLAPYLRGESRERLAEIGNDLGLADYARRCCRSRFWWRRLRGARLLTVLGSGGGVMRSLLDDPDEVVRAQAAEWAAGSNDTEVLNRLLFMLNDASAICRYTAKDSLLRIGDAAVGPTARFLFHAPAGTVEPALEVALGLASPVFLPAARKLVHDAPTARGRALAALLLSGIGVGDAADTLQRLLTDAAADVRVAAARGLGRIGHWAAAPALGDRLEDDVWEVRRQAALALRELGAPGMLVLQRASRGEPSPARDLARHVLDLPTLPMR